MHNAELGEIWVYVIDRNIIERGEWISHLQEIPYLLLSCNPRHETFRAIRLDTGQECRIHLPSYPEHRWRRVS